MADTPRASTTTPLPSPPPRKSGLPDLRKSKPRPGQARGAWGGSRPPLPVALIPIQRDPLLVLDLELAGSPATFSRPGVLRSPRGDCQLLIPLTPRGNGLLFMFPIIAAHMLLAA